MEFELNKSVEILQRTPKILRILLGNLPMDLTHQNEGGDSWSAFEILGHLIHGERTDWVPRVKILLGKNETKEFEPFDRFAHLQSSKGKSLNELITQFEKLRLGNIEEVKDLRISINDLELTGIHPELGTVTLKQLFATWVVHDLSHIAQVSRVMAKQYKDEVGPWESYLGILHK